MYKTNGTIVMFAIDTGESFKYKGRLKLLKYEFSDNEVKMSYDRACKGLGRKIKNPVLVIAVEDDLDHEVKAWTNGKDIKKLIIHQQKIFTCKPEYVESVWLEMPVKSRKSLWVRGLIDQVFDRLPEGRTKEYAIKEVQDYWNPKLERHSLMIQGIIDGNKKWFNMEIKDFVAIIQNNVPQVLHSSLYAYYRDHDCDWKNDKLKQSLYTHRVI